MEDERLSFWLHKGSYEGEVACNINFAGADAQISMPKAFGKGITQDGLDKRDKSLPPSMPNEECTCTNSEQGIRGEIWF